MFVKIGIIILIIFGDIVFLLTHQNYGSTIPDVFGCIILGASIWYGIYQIFEQLPKKSSHKRNKQRSSYENPFKSRN